MNISIIVERNPANKQGADIIDSLISSNEQAKQLGRMHIDTNSTNRFIVSGSSPISAYMEPGGIVQVIDLQKGKYNSMLNNYSASITKQSDSKFTAVTSISIEREV